MLYYKVIKDGYDYFNKNAIVKNELLTTKERNSKVSHLPDSYFQIIEIPKTKVFWSFGVRFEKSPRTKTE